MFGTSISGGCSIVEEAIEDQKEKLFQQMGFRWHFVDYSEEGKIALIHNDCNPDDWQEVPYTPAELASRGEEEQREYEATMWDRVRDINASPCVVDGDASFSEAQGWVRAFRRIDVNGSLASFELAKAEIVGKLLKQYGPGPSVVPGAQDGIKSTRWHMMATITIPFVLPIPGGLSRMICGTKCTICSVGVIQIDTPPSKAGSANSLKAQQMARATVSLVVTKYASIQRAILATR
jgi:hypothetical protein